MISALLVLTLLSCLIWMGLLTLRGGFWRCDQRLDCPVNRPEWTDWPRVCAIIPARDEAAYIGATVRSLLTQDYAGAFEVVLVDDQSSDATAALAQQTAADLGEGHRLRILTTPPLPPGWSGKLWAVNTGVQHVLQAPGRPPDYLLLSDADIVHPKGNLTALLSKAITENRLLVSLMVQLRCQSFWEKALIPAFIFFFQKLYPFPWANSSRHKLAAAAGGCILLQRQALLQAGGLERVKDALIDDCSLAAAVKQTAATKDSGKTTWGRIWLGLSTQTHSLRAYDTLDTIWTMVARTAFTQLGYSTVLLLGSVLGMILVYLWPPLAIAVGALTQHPWIALCGGLAWLLMAIAYLPTVRLYRLPPLWAMTLPATALLYTLMTLDSARRHWQGRGGAWKGRVYPAKS
ncbi:glycosyltransferase [Lyngbya confervoides]|uniref:Glycosyltransferase n=1 Tax=Lyngbya confervoides BDU141951 TaxID=1574623 RepID=A0ABD4T475_9CYAN|nr:glycosyltransferase [Lyngbya confervoides]MCM1983125.1 glycosyltransferase [Lyngbya confervoides BDU141951]